MYIYLKLSFIIYQNREYISGIPEIIKCGLIDNSDLLNYVKTKNKIIQRDFSFVSKIIKKL